MTPDYIQQTLDAIKRESKATLDSYCAICEANRIAIANNPEYMESSEYIATCDEKHELRRKHDELHDAFLTLMKYFN